VFSQTNTGRTRKTKNYVFFLKQNFLKKTSQKSFPKKRKKKEIFFKKN